MESIEQIAVLGAGRCGRQILHCLASTGFRAIAFEETQERLDFSRGAFLSERYPNIEAVGREHQQRKELVWTTCSEVLREADLVIESIVENLPAKKKLVGNLMATFRDETILTTNSSYFLPSSVFQGATHPERVASLHFHVPPWFATAVDIMPTMRTSPHTLDLLQNFVQSLGLTPIRLGREFPGYVFNSLLHPLLVKSLELAQRRVAPPETVDLAWRSVTGMPTGPFGMMQQIGVSTLSTILERALNVYQDEGTRLAKEFLDGWNGELVHSTEPRPRLSIRNHLPEIDSNFQFKQFRQQWQNSIEAKHNNISTHGKRFQILGKSDFAIRLSNALDACDYFSNADELDLGKPTIWLCEAEGDLNVHCSHWWFKQIKFLQRFLTKHAEASCDSQLYAVLPLDDYGNLQPQTWGMPGMFRSAWQEQFTMDGTVANPVDLKILSIRFHDLQAVEDLATKVKQLIAPSTSNRIRSELEDVNQRTLDYTEMELRHDRGVWNKPTLMPVSNSTRSKVDNEASCYSRVATLEQQLSNSTWIVSDGGRGITARLARKLGEYGAKLFILGQTLEPDEPLYSCSDVELAERKKERCRDAAKSSSSLATASLECDAELELSRNLHWLRSNSVSFEYRAIDVTSKAEIFQLSTELKQRQIDVHGVLHGAGYAQTTRLQRKSDKTILETLSSKIDTSVALTSLLSPQSKWFIQCGSSAGTFGVAGQVDFAAADGFQACYSQALACRWPDLQVLTIGWPAWDEAGLAARAASTWALRRQGQRLMSIDEGLAHFANLLQANASGYVLLMNSNEIPQNFSTQPTT